MLYLYRRIAFGDAAGEDTASMKDLSAREWLLLLPLAAAALWMGIYPESFLAPMRQDSAALAARMSQAAPAGDGHYRPAPSTRPAAQPSTSHGSGGH
jgi:NADH-quinone oxidoreductase subunit M